MKRFFKGWRGGRTPAPAAPYPPLAAQFSRQLHGPLSDPNSGPPPVIGIIAGSGQFPVLVARSLRASGIRSAICGFAGYTDPALAAEADIFNLVPMGQVGRVISFFHTHNVKQLCLAGAIEKPRALDLRPDLRAARMLLKMRHLGDDSILRAVADELASEGLEVIASGDLVPGLRAPAGILTRRNPSPAVIADIRHAWDIGKALGAYDIGQCLVVRERMIMAVEAIEGTDAVLERGGRLGGKGCTALKLLKPQQDERLDLPSLGLNTVRLLITHHYACLAYEAGKTLFFDQEASIAEANRHNLTIIGLTNPHTDQL